MYFSNLGGCDIKIMLKTCKGHKVKQEIFEGFNFHRQVLYNISQVQFLWTQVSMPVCEHTNVFIL